MDVFVIRENELGNADTGYKHSEQGNEFTIDRDYISPGREVFDHYLELLDKTQKVKKIQDIGHFRYRYEAYKGARGDRMLTITLYQKTFGGRYQRVFKDRYPKKK